MKARENPFRVSRVEALDFRFHETDLTDLLERLERQRWCAVVGPCGSGKTTLCLRLQSVLAARGLSTRYLMINDRHPLTPRGCRDMLGGLTGREIVFLDGAEQIRQPIWTWLRRLLQRRAAGLVVTAHAPGLLPTLYECRTGAALFAELVSSLWPPQAGRLDAQVLAEVYSRSGGNLRTGLRELYDICSDCPTVLTAPGDRSVSA